MSKIHHLPWHESSLISVKVDRQNPGEQDIVEIAIRLLDDEVVFLRFRNCYLFEAKMNFGIVADESILSASVRNNGKEIEFISNFFFLGQVPIAPILALEINTISTGSKIKIVFLDTERALSRWI
jgi:hypothetical protein